jgi:hypothetical protein
VKKGGESDARKIRPSSDADSTIGANHGSFGRGGDNSGHVAHYLATSGKPLKRQ